MENKNTTALGQVGCMQGQWHCYVGGGGAWFLRTVIARRVGDFEAVAMILAQPDSLSWQVQSGGNTLFSHSGRAPLCTARCSGKPVSSCCHQMLSFQRLLTMSYYLLPTNNTTLSFQKQPFILPWV